MRLIFTLIFPVFAVHSLIVPDEIPTILSVIYSNIPVLKKGTDSRLGWGFRLGNRADFQVLVELGPQTYTQPLANQGDGGNSKRNALGSLAEELYAQRLHEKHHGKHVSDTEGGKWLESWSKSVHKKKGPRPGIGVGEIDAKSVIPEDRVDAGEAHDESGKKRLEELYRARNESDETEESES